MLCNYFIFLISVQEATAGWGLAEPCCSRAFVHLLDPTYTIPGRKALKQMLDEKYKVTKDQAVAQVSKGVHSQLNSRYVDLNKYGRLLGSDLPLHYRRGPAVNYSARCKNFPRSHTASHIAEAKDTDGRVGNLRQRSLVTDAAPNMVACANLLNVRHINCFAYMLNLVVKSHEHRTLMTSAPRQRELWHISNQAPQQKRSCQKYSDWWEDQSINFCKRLCFRGCTSRGSH